MLVYFNTLFQTLFQYVVQCLVRAIVLYVFSWMTLSVLEMRIHCWTALVILQIMTVTTVRMLESDVKVNPYIYVDDRLV